MRGIWKSSIGEVLTVVSSAPRVREGVRGALRGVFWLLRVQLDDELLLHGRRDLTALGLAQHLGGERVVVGLQPGRHLGGELGGVADDRVGAGAGLHGDDVAVADLVAGDVHPAAVDRPMAVADELARLAARGGEAEPDQHVVEEPLEQREQVLAGDALLARGLVVVAGELLLQHAVVALGLLLLAQLHAVLGLALAAAAVVAGRVGASLDAALVGQAALALEEELLPLAAALLALGAGVSSHGSDPPPLARPDAVVGLRGDVLDAGDLQTRGLQRADRGLAPRARALDEHLDLLQALFDALARRSVGGDLRGERRRLARALEAGAAGGLPGDDVALAVGEGDDRVVEAGLDVGLADGDVLLRLAAAGAGALRSGHSVLTSSWPSSCPRPASAWDPCACGRWSSCSGRGPAGRGGGGGRGWGRPP